MTDESWRQEYAGMIPLGTYKKNLLQNGPKSLSQSWMMQAMYNDWKKERYQRSRATELPEQHEGMGRKYKEIPDPWFN